MVMPHHLLIVWVGDLACPAWRVIRAVHRTHSPITHGVVHLDIAPSRNYLTARRFLEEIEDLYGNLPDTEFDNRRFE